MTIAKEARLAEPVESGVHLLLGAQEELRINVGFGNFRGPAVDISGLVDGLQLSLNRDGRDLPIVIGRTTKSPNPVQHFAEGDGIDISCVVRREDGKPFGPGTYALAVSMGEATRSLKTPDGRPWTGQMKMVDRRLIVIREARSKEELITLWRIEGNDHLFNHRPLEAIPYLQRLAAELPDDWQAQGALGEAYLQTKQYEPAAAAFERAMPGWLKFPERRGELIANSLVRAYLALKRDGDAARVLRSVGVPENAISSRLNVLRRLDQ